MKVIYSPFKEKFVQNTNLCDLLLLPFIGEFVFPRDKYMPVHAWLGFEFHKWFV
jgi:hypothetical protein